MRSTTMFSFGYWGWGNATEPLVQLVDAVEKDRGFKPPLFVDIRISRSVRAEGFRDNNFADMVGPKRYIWLKGLGNKRIITKRGPKVQIANPHAAAELLERAIDASVNRRRVIFFCSCEFPLWDGKLNCHRVTAAKLVLKEAQQSGLRVTVSEWPGQGKREIDLEVDEATFGLLRKARNSIPLGRKVDLAAIGSLGFGSLVTVRCGTQTLRRVVDRTVWRNDQWQLPVREWFVDPKTSSEDYRRLAKHWKKQLDFGSSSV